MSNEYQYRALSFKVLTVASINLDVGDFSVYIDAVEGISYDYEYKDVVAYGTKLDERIAEILYPQLFERYIWRE